MMTSWNGNIYRVTGHLCGDFTGPGEFPAQRPVTRIFEVFFDLRLNKRLSKQSWGWWFETPSRPLWRHSNTMMPREYWRLGNLSVNTMFLLSSDIITRQSMFGTYGQIPLWISYCGGDTSRDPSSSCDFVLLLCKYCHFVGWNVPMNTYFCCECTSRNAWNIKILKY